MSAARLTIRLAVAVAMLFSLLACNRQYRRAEPLHEIYAPTFRQLPDRLAAPVAVARLQEDWRGQPGDVFRRDVGSWQGLAVAGSLVVLLVAGVNWSRPRDGRHLDLALLWMIGVCLFNSLRLLQDHNLRDPAYLTLLGWVFTAVTVLSATLMVRAIWRAARPAGNPWRPSAPSWLLIIVGGSLIVVNLGLALHRPPDDAGVFANLGGQRLRERGLLPYGDPLLTGTPGAAYGPLLYAAHVPFQVIVSPAPVNERSPAKPELGAQTTYFSPPLVATQLCVAAFHLLGVFALFIAARRLAGRHAALALVCLYCGSLAVLGVGGQEYSVAGITFASHIAPASMTLLAFGALSRPALAGAMLVAAAGVGFYPAFMGPAWLGYYWGDRQARWRFVAGCALTATLLIILVVALSRPAGGQSRLGTIFADTFGHHTESAGYGSSPFGFWGRQEGIRSTLQRPLLGSGMTSPLWLGMVALIVASGRLAYRRSPASLALLSAAIALAAATIKPHATGSYLAWYYGLFLLGLTGVRGAGGAEVRTANQHPLP